MNENDSAAKKIIKGAGDLSLAISMVVAVAIGAGLGIGLKRLFGYEWLLYAGILLGVAAAISNFVKAYKKLRREMNELENNPRYKRKDKDDEDEDED
ncbi:MAG: AtpZ/AtpI family protein [Helicobacteraceae bacterium]|jgi:F0F1-type ATP synthase assembly protein I|nr:AtpZ/AtpI family protein [Helicobacteraceae bacterium]